MASVQDGIIVPALQEIGVLSPEAGEVGTSAAITTAFDRLNQYIDRLAAENLTIYTVTRTVATLTANQASFSVGAGGNINIARPVFIEKVNFIDTTPSPDMEYQLGDLLTEQEYAAIPNKAATSPFPSAAYYNPTFPTGTLIPWPIPNSATLQWAVYAWTALTQFATLATTVSLPPGYQEALTMNLAVLLCASYEKKPHTVTVKAATDGMAVIKRANKRLVDMTFDAACLGDNRQWGWDIRTGP